METFTQISSELGGKEIALSYLCEWCADNFKLFPSKGGWWIGTYCVHCFYLSAPEQIVIDSNSIKLQNKQNQEGIPETSEAQRESYVVILLIC